MWTLRRGLHNESGQSWSEGFSKRTMSSLLDREIPKGLATTQLRTMFCSEASPLPSGNSPLPQVSFLFFVIYQQFSVPFKSIFRSVCDSLQSISAYPGAPVRATTSFILPSLAWLFDR